MMSKAEKVDLRLQCLRIATANDLLLTPDQAISAARELFDYVIDAPVRQTLFVVRRTRAREGSDPSLTHLSIVGNWVTWSVEGFAYRFRSYDEALQAANKYEQSLFGEGEHPSYVIERMHESFEPF